MEFEELNVPGTPAVARRWIWKKVLKEAYVFYDKKKHKASCSRCGKTFEFYDDVRNGETGFCPKCEAAVTFRSHGLGRKKLTEHFRTLVFTRRGQIVYAVLSEVTVDFRYDGRPGIEEIPIEVYRFSHKKQERWSRDYYGKFQPAKNSAKLPGPPGGYGWYGYYATKFSETYAYTENLKEIFSKSCLKYMYDDTLLKQPWIIWPNHLIAFIDYSLKYPAVEVLMKTGFQHLVEGKLMGERNYRRIRWRENHLTKILGMNKEDIKRIRPYKLSPFELNLFRTLTDKEKKTSIDEAVDAMRAAQEYNYKDEDKIKTFNVIRSCGLKRWREWIETEKVEMRDWRDYLNDLKALGITISRKVMMPEGFAERHMEIAEMVKVERNKETDEKIREHLAEIDIQDERFLIKNAASQQDLCDESAELHHCVRTYGNKLASGRSHIYFIRRKEEPDKPFYTLEINENGEFVQCRGLRNCLMTDEVEAFKDKVLKEFNNRYTKERKAWAS